MDTQSSEKSHTSVSARRRLFQILAVGGTAAVVLPEKWVKPVVDAVIVPAHAAGSVVRADGIFGNRGSLFVTSNRMNPVERFAEMFVGSAHADVPLTCGAENVLCISFVIAPLPSQTVQVFVDGNSSSSPASPVISANNAIENVTVGNLVFTNLIASSTSISGYVTSSRSDCSSGPLMLSRRASNVCVSG